MNLEELTMGLRERAKRAHEERERARQEDLDEAFYDLECDTVAFCQSKLGFSPENFQRNTFVYQKETLPRLHFKVDGIEFRAGIRLEAITINQSGKNETVAHDRIFFLEVKSSQYAWEEVHELADVGKVVS